MSMWSPAAENLVLGTGVQESDNFTFLKQYRGGPGLSIYQIEPVTHRDIYKNYLNYPNREELCKIITKMRGHWDFNAALVFNFVYATAICRIVYRRRPEALPHDDPDNAHKLAKLWKVGFNTVAGKGTVEQFEEKYLKYIKKDS